VMVTDRAMESANATTIITVGPQRVLGLPQAMGLAVIFGAIVGTSALTVLLLSLTLRRKKGRRPPTTA
jgi:Na+/phosphate symporter